MTYDVTYFQDAYLDDRTFEIPHERAEREKLGAPRRVDQPRRKRNHDVRHNGIWRRRVHRIV